MSRTAIKLLVLGFLTAVAPTLQAQEYSQVSIDHKTRGSRAGLSHAQADYESATDGMRSRAMLQSCGQLVVGVDYGRPSLGERDLDGIHEGFVWRLGKGRPTILKTTSRITLPGAELAPGIYSLFLKHEGAGEWSLIIHRGGRVSNPNRRNPEEDVAAIPLVTADPKEHQEVLSINLEPVGDSSALLNIAWGTHSVSTTLKVEENAIHRCR